MISICSGHIDVTGTGFADCTALIDHGDISTGKSCCCGSVSVIKSTSAFGGAKPVFVKGIGVFDCKIPQRILSGQISVLVNGYASPTICLSM